MTFNKNKNPALSLSDQMKIKVSPEDDERIICIKRDHWIGYDHAISIRSQMEDLLRHPRTHRMPNIALIGDTNNGKSMLLNNLCKNNNLPEIPSAEKTILPVLMVQTPPSADEGRLYYAILDKLCAAGSAREAEDSKLRRIKIILQHLETKVLVLDDFFNVASSSPSRRRKFLNALRNLSITLELPIIISGIPETLNILTIDRSISNRFKPLFLPKWTEARLTDFARFIVSFEQIIKLKKPCNLMDDEYLKKLLIFGEGLIGEVVAILRLFAELAIRSGSETITGDMLTHENLKALGWVMPSDRTRHIG